MPGIDVPQIEEGGAVTQLLEQDAVGPHAQRAFEQLLGANLGQALPLARIDHMDDIAMRHDQPTGVFDGKQPLLRWDKLDERFRAGRLSRTRGATDQHVLACRRSEAHTSELQSLLRISYAVSCLKKKTNNTTAHVTT